VTVTDDLLRRLRCTEDPEERTQLARQLAVGAGHPDASVLSALIELLGADSDPDVKDWGTVGLRRRQRDPRVETALWSSFRNAQERESVRAYALAALTKLGLHVGGDELRELYATRRLVPDDLLLTIALRGVGENAVSEDMLRVLLELQDRDARQPGQARVVRAAIGAAIFRCARGCIAAGSIDRPWLARHGRQDVLDRLGETRMQRLIAERRAQLQQPSLLGSLDADADDTPLVPGLPLADFQAEQYADDVAEMNVDVVEKRSFIRDQALARAAKKDADYACEVCRDRLDHPAQRQRFVQVHHIKPLSEGGADTAENMVVICPTCHARVHAGELSITRKGGAVVVCGPDNVTAQALPPRDRTACSAGGVESVVKARIVGQLERLSPDQRTRLLIELHLRFGTPAPIEGGK